MKVRLIITNQRRMLEGIKAIYFDLDNTLIDRNAAFMDTILELYKPYPELKIDILFILKRDNLGYTPLNEFCDWLILEYPIPNYTSADIFAYLIHNITHQPKRQSHF